MIVFVKIASIFFAGSMLGWTAELFFRRAVHKRWINPGFLAGPCLPLYGSGILMLYLICSADFSFISSPVWRSVFVIVLITVLMTFLEYITGLFFTKKMNVKLWDYSDRFGNIQGIICPLFTFLWGAAGALYYFFIHGVLTAFTEWMGNNPVYAFFTGIAAGIFILDVCYSFHIVSRVRAWAKKNEVVVKYEELKLSIRRRAEKFKQKRSFLFSFRSKNGVEGELESYSAERNKQ